MIKIYTFSLVIILLLGLSNNSYCQKPSADSTKTKDSATINNLSNKVDEILQRLKASNTTDREQTGVILFDTSKKISIYTTTNYKKSARTVVIDKVTLLIQDGYVIDVQVFAGEKNFTNVWSPISINSKRFSDLMTDYLINKKDNGEAIILQDALTYTPFNTFFPEDGLVTLTSKNPADTLAKNVGVNTVVDLRLYTDALAAFGKEPNGLFQTDVRVKQFIHRKHYFNKGSRIFQYIKINFTASKMDSKNSFVDSSDKLSRSALFQKSKINAEAVVNLFGSWLGRKTLNNYYIDMGGGFSRVDLARLHDTIMITVPAIFFESGISLRNSSNIGFEFYSRFTYQFSPETDFNRQDKDVKFLRIGGEAFWNPFKDPASRVFGRINYTMGLSNAEKKNSFSQIQIGYSTLLSKAIGKN